MKSFVEAWSAKFQPDKYPLDFYFSKINDLSFAKSPESAGQTIIELLHWKDGKVLKDSNGEVVIETERYKLLATKPNTYNITKHKEIFCSTEFFQWIQEVKAIRTFDARRVKDLSSVFNLYGKDSIVIPSFILHVISPMIYPLYDQHVERAKRVLLAQEIRFPRDEINLTTYQEYQLFFQELVGTCFGQQPRFEEIKNVDNALWSFGKWFKEQYKSGGNQLNPTPVDDRKHNPDEEIKKEGSNDFTQLPGTLQGRSILEKVIPTVCKLEQMLNNLILVNGDYSMLKQWEKRCYNAYQIEKIKESILSVTPDQRKTIIKKHILSGNPNDFGANCIDIYLVAYVAETFGTGRETFYKYILNNGISEKENSASAIWQVGKGDGVYLGVLNDDGTIRDRDFFVKWINGD
jgi:hypothetical protein